jgi:exonuclease SbcD
MKTKFLYSTDWHCRGKNPSSRLDDYPATIEMKVRTFFRLGEEYEVDAYLCGGDMMDTPYSSPQYVARIGSAIEEELNKVNKKMYYILGNHDIIAYNPESIHQTTFGLFLKFSQRLVPLTKNPIVVNGVYLTGVHSYAMLDKPVLNEIGEIVKPRWRDWVVEKTEGPHIHIVHGFLTPKPLLEDIPHSLIEEMKHTKATVTLGAHDHTGFPVTKIDNGLVYNPGALGRVFASYNEMNRMPKYALITIHEDGSPEIQPIICPVAEEGKNVLNRDLIEQKKQKEAFLSQVRNDVKELVEQLNVESINLYSILNEYKSKTKPEVYREVMRRLQL